MRTLPVIAALSLALAGCNILPDAKDQQPRQTSNPSIAPSAAGRQCLAEFGKTGARFTALPDKYYSQSCSALNAVSVASLKGDQSSFALTNLGPVTCPTANRFSAWARYGVDRAARQILGSPLAKIETMGSYACRNIAGSNKRSAHSRAEAIDIAGFVLADGRRISVRNDWNGGTRQEREFLRIVHRSACKRFGTVLGPEYNAAHEDHFHLEKGNGSFCR